MRHDKIILGWTVLGLLALALVLGVGAPGGAHTTYINGSRVQSPSFNATGNITINDSLLLFGNGTIRGGKLGGALNAAGFPINNPVLSNVTADLISGQIIVNRTAGIVGIGATMAGMKLWAAGPSNSGGGFEVVDGTITRLHFTGQAGYATYLEKDASTGNIKLVNGHVGFPFKINMTTEPTLNNTFNIGSAGLAWKEGHIVTLYAGDINFGNGFKIVESSVSDESDGIPKIYFIDNFNNTILAMGKGSIYLKGASSVNLSRTLMNTEYDRLNLAANVTRQKAKGYVVG